MQQWVSPRMSKLLMACEFSKWSSSPDWSFICYQWRSFRNILYTLHRVNHVIPVCLASWCNEIEHLPSFWGSRTLVHAFYVDSSHSHSKLLWQRPFHPCWSNEMYVCLLWSTLRETSWRYAPVLPQHRLVLFPLTYLAPIELLLMFWHRVTVFQAGPILPV